MFWESDNLLLYFKMFSYDCVGFDIALSADKHNLIVCLSLST